MITKLRLPVLPLLLALCLIMLGMVGKPAQAQDGVMTSGGPDHYGYTWDDAGQPFQWIDAANQTALTGDDNYIALPLPFSFPFYENTYSLLYASTNGLITFGAGNRQYDNQPIPQAGEPDDFIAPFWDELAIDGAYNSGHLDTAQLSSPDRFVVEWQSVTLRGSTDLLTFEVIFYPNGNFCFQYLQMQGTVTAATVGSEDPDGYDGLQYLYNQPGIGSLVGVKALCFHRPGADARVKALPPYQSSFVSGRQSQFQVSVRNIGQEGADTYDLFTAQSGSPWEVTFYDAGGSNPLVDTDADGDLDTGAIAQGDEAQITARIQADTGAAAGDYSDLLLTIRSSLNPSQTAEVSLQSAMPSSFTQLHDDSKSGMRFQVIQPGSITTLNVIMNFTGSAQNMIALPLGFYFLTWERNGPGYSNLEYAVISSFAYPIVRPTVLTDNQEATQTTYDYSPLTAVLPNGRVGLTWYRNIISGTAMNSNVYLAIMAPSGQILHGPLNVTNNDGWVEEGAYNVPSFSATSIAATQDNHFILSWVDERTQPAGMATDVVYAVYNSNGGVLMSPYNATNSSPGEMEYLYPNLIMLDNDRSLLAYSAHELAGSVYTVTYRVLDSAGNLFYGPEEIPSSSGWVPDSVQLSGGNILIAWTDSSTHQINFAILDGASYDVHSGPIALPSPYNRWVSNVSVTYDAAGRGILTWVDDKLKEYLFYALVNSDGDVLTPPMIFRSRETASSKLYVSNAGGGNAPYNLGRVWLPLIIK